MERYKITIKRYHGDEGVDFILFAVCIISSDVMGASNIASTLSVLRSVSVEICQF